MTGAYDTLVWVYICPSYTKYNLSFLKNLRHLHNEKQHRTSTRVRLIGRVFSLKCLLQLLDGLTLERLLRRKVGRLAMTGEEVDASSLLIGKLINVLY